MLGQSVALLTNRHDVDAYDGIFQQVEQMAVYGDEAREILSQGVERYRGFTAD